jgi:Lon protease-like protein
MTASPFDPGFEALPRVIPIFPLTGALLLPGGQLPLNIFEPRYLAMTRAALAEDARIIGMVQPRVPDFRDNRGPAPGTPADGGPEIYAIGCAGRITAFSETQDGRYVMTLSGLIRFAITEEMALKDGYRRVLADYSRFRGDLAPQPDDGVDRDRLLSVMRSYFAHQGIDANWDSIEGADNERLVTTMAMTCPFAPPERQALLEAPRLAERSGILITLMEMANADLGDAPPEMKN